MDWGQSLRAWWRSVRARIADMRAHARSAGESAIDAGSGALGQQRIGRVARIALAIAIVLAVIYPVSAWLYSTIDDNPQFGPANDAGNPRASQTVSAIASLVDREVNTHGWAASVPFFEPPALLQHMPKYQEGIVAALANVALALRARSIDSNLASAGELLQYPPDIWYWNPRQSLWPKMPSDDQYLRAAAALESYNESLNAGDVQFDRSAEALEALLAPIAQDLDSQSSTIEYHLDRATRPRVEERTDAIFYGTKGRLYGYYVVLKGVQIDYREVLASRHLTATWSSMMATLRAAIGMRPSIVLDGAPDSDFVPCTLCGQGFYLLRVRSELQDIEKTLR